MFFLIPSHLLSIALWIVCRFLILVIVSSRVRAPYVRAGNLQFFFFFQFFWFFLIRYVKFFTFSIHIRLQVMIDTAYWTILNHIVIWGSFVVYFFTTWFYNKYIGGKYAGALDNVRNINAITKKEVWFFYKRKINFRP